MELFAQIEDAQAIVRLPKGVYKQTKVYRRGERIFVPHGPGFLRVCAKLGNSWGTSHPDISVIEFSDELAAMVSKGEPRFLSGKA